MSLYKPHQYQINAISHVLTNSFSGLFAQVGRGKTSITLTAIEQLLSTFDTIKVLIIAPKRVASHTWKAETEKWDHTKHLKVARIIGNTPNKRIKALNVEADIYTVSRDNIAWLVQYFIDKKRKWPFDFLVIDESSNFRNRAAMRYKAVRKILPHTQRLLLLTGTPFTKSLEGVWAQVFLLDKGKRLGPTLSSFRDQYMTPKFNGFGYTEKPGSTELVSEKIKDICISIKNSDFDDVPERVDITEFVELENMAAYLEFKKTETLHILEKDLEITPVNAGALYNKLLQFCNGSIYVNDKGEHHVVSESKMDAFVEEIEALDGEPVFVAYMFKSDFERMQKRIPGIVKLETDEQIEAFNRGEIPVLASHPASNAYGLNLQAACHNIIFYGLPWDLELYQQFIGRIHRQNQQFKTINKRLITAGTVEELVLQRLGEKDFNQDKLLELMKLYIK